MLGSEIFGREKKKKKRSEEEEKRSEIMEEMTLSRVPEFKVEKKRY